MAKTDPSLDFYCAHYIAAVKCSSVVLFTGLNILCRLLIFFLWNDHSRNRISTGASTIPAHDSSLYGWMLIAVVPAQMGYLLCLFADCTGCSVANASVLQVCVQCMLLWPCTLLLMILVRVHVAFLKSRAESFQPKAHKLEATFLDFPGRTECFWGVIAWINTQTGVSAKLDWALAAMWTSAKWNSSYENSCVHVHDANIPLHNLLELEQLVPGCLQAALLPRTNAGHKQ